MVSLYGRWQGASRVISANEVSVALTEIDHCGHGCHMAHSSSILPNRLDASAFGGAQDIMRGGYVFQCRLLALKVLVMQGDP